MIYLLLITSIIGFFSCLFMVSHEKSILKALSWTLAGLSSLTGVAVSVLLLVIPDFFSS